MLSRLNFSHRHETRSTFANSVSDELGSLSFTFGAKHGSFGFLLTLENYEFGALCPLLGNLFLLDSAGEVSRELQVCD